ncbi:uncharacterized protein LOC143918579 [Arctopsyche grandis]|uniref:uncharacterized protein LOC143918579 n=1 Tax=Arctopsyche grandis TaxID=121162 RepID=UPI00406D6B30
MYILIWLYALFALTNSFGFVAGNRKNINFPCCNEESTNNDGSPVTWSNVPGSERKVASDPLCLNKDQELITRSCDSCSWNPKHDEVPDCSHIQTRPTASPCPPDFNRVVNSTGQIMFCYRLIEAQNWHYPCLKYGFSKTILDLDQREFDMLINNSDFTDKRRVWLPARRMVPYGPIVWTTLGKNWGKKVDIDNLENSRLPLLQSCLLFDLITYTYKTENCSFQYPSICIFKGAHLLPLHCPKGYATTRYSMDDNRCYGMEISEKPKTWNDFVTGQCDQPLQIPKYIQNHLFREISKYHDYDLEKLCWTALAKINNKFFWYPNSMSSSLYSNLSFVNWDPQTNFTTNDYVRGVINEKYQWLLLHQNETLSCMACQTQVPKADIELSLQFVPDSFKILLTVYNPKRIWKESLEEPGMQCFTNAEGFVSVVDIEEDVYRRVRFPMRQLVTDLIGDVSVNEVDKVVYEVEIDSDEAGEYWCEGHTSTEFKRISTSRLLVPSKNSDEHLFVLKLEVFNFCIHPSACDPDLDEETTKIKRILNVKSVRMMEIKYIDLNGTATIIYHLTVQLKEFERCEGTLHCNVVRAHSYILNVCESQLPKYKYNFLSLSSTIYCLPAGEYLGLHWEITPIGENTAPREFCMQSNGLPVTRKCGGSFVSGGRWNHVMGECSRNYKPSTTTTYLYSLAKGRTDLETASLFLTHDMNILLNDTELFIPADIYFLSLSLKMIVEMSDQNSSLIELGDSTNIATAIDSIMNIDESYLNLAQTMNSSNVLLESIDMIVSKIALNESDSLLLLENGIDLAVTPLFVLQISNPVVSNITGLALTRKEGVNSTLFTDMNIIPLTANMTVNDVLKIERLEIATWVTEDLLNSIRAMNRSDNATVANVTLPNIIINIFYNDVVFQETTGVKDIVNSRIISVTLPGFESDLPMPLSLIYKRFDVNASSDRVCSYWDFMVQNPFSLGQWSKKGCYSVANYGELDFCACFHLTHFAQLVLGYKNETTDGVIILQVHGRALNAITLVGCSLSLVGVSGIAATAVIFKTWRQKPGTKILLQLSAAIALQSLMMVSQDGWWEKDIQCVILGALLHYSVLAAFMWMLVTAILQFARYVKVLGKQRPSRFLIKFSLAGWGLPVVPVAILLIVDYTAYLPPCAISGCGLDPSALCYPQGLGLYLSVLLPIGCIVATNLTVFILVMRSITKSPEGMRRTTDPETVMSQLRLSILLFFLLGLSWIFGLFALTSGRIIFSYLFCLTATLQGFILFIYFVVCDPATRVLWVSLVREKSISKDSI